ncbi:hypothetical protein BH09MYX1_BH09MYX1_55190 [soil metagenome]
MQADAEWYVPWTQGVGGLHGHAPDGFWLSPIWDVGRYGKSTVAGSERGGPMWAHRREHRLRPDVVRHIHLDRARRSEPRSRLGLAEPPSYARFYPTVDGTIGYAF